MPAHRRARNKGAAAALPASRLPLGAPAVIEAQRIISRSTHHSSPTSDPHSPESQHDVEIEQPMSSSEAAENALRAAEKLRRQQERIEREELALNSGVPLFEKPKQNSQRAKGKTVWSPFDLGEHTSQQTEDHVVRVNKYSAALSRDTSLSRSLSSVSQQTTNTTTKNAVEMERIDSAMADNAGFQTYLRRGTRPKGPSEQIAHGDRVKKQKTVEGEPDRDEVLAVFKQPLPTPDFITASPGITDGIVQFVQHPNGDVAAHMWSQRSYQWENIGQFSNIRKRIEGQLAGERLKGETAYQKLQQNSLAYFRVVAKQREAAAMGIAFGQDNIREALPEPQKMVSATGQQNPASKSASAAEEERDRMLRQRLDDTLLQELRRDPDTYQQRSLLPASPPQRAQRTSSQGLSPSAKSFVAQQPISVKTEDPFSSSAQNQNSFPAFGWQTGFNTFGAALPVPNASRNNVSTRSSLGLPLLPGQAPRLPFYSGSGAGVTNSAGPAAKQPTFLFPPAAYSKPKSATLGIPVTPSPSTPTSRNKPATPLSSREALRDQLHRTVDTAVKRSLSQANIARTVAYDPVAQEQRPQVQVQEVDADDQYWPDSNSEACSEPESLSLMALAKEVTREEYEERCTNWYDTQPMDKNEQQNLALILTQFSISGNPQPFTVADRLSPITQSQALEPSYGPGKSQRNDYERELNEWFNNGSTFSRQEELYKHIMTTAPRSSPPGLGVPSSATRTVDCPFGTSPTSEMPTEQAISRSIASHSSYNEGLTRVLIPVYENLASYVQGPGHQRHDYWAPWVQPPEWCIDRSPTGNNSFFDNLSARPPPARVGRDPRYKKMPAEMLQFGGLSPQASRTVGTPLSSYGGLGMGMPLGARFSGGYAYGRY